MLICSLKYTLSFSTQTYFNAATYYSFIVFNNRNLTHSFTFIHFVFKFINIVVFFMCHFYPSHFLPRRFFPWFKFCIPWTKVPCLCIWCHLLQNKAICIGSLKTWPTVRRLMVCEKKVLKTIFMEKSFYYRTKNPKRPRK